MVRYSVAMVVDMAADAAVGIWYTLALDVCCRNKSRWLVVILSGGCR
jgi:hypothetical protein